MWLTIRNDIEPVNSACRRGREHGADRKAWVARLATPVDGVSVVAPTFDRGTESSGEHHHERLALAVDLDGLLQWINLTGH